MRFYKNAFLKDLLSFPLEKVNESNRNLIILMKFKAINEVKDLIVPFGKEPQNIDFSQKITIQDLERLV